MSKLPFKAFTQGMLLTAFCNFVRFTLNMLEGVRPDLSVVTLCKLSVVTLLPLHCLHLSSGQTPYNSFYKQLLKQADLSSED